MSSRRDDQLKHRDNFTFTFTLLGNFDINYESA